MTLLWHDAAAGTWEACACRMAGGEAPPHNSALRPSATAPSGFPCPEERGTLESRAET